MTADLYAGLTDDLPHLDDQEPVRPRGRRPGSARRPPARVQRRQPPPVEPVNYYPDVAEFVSGFLAPLYAREWNKMDREWKWCARWWLHVEAVVRLEALWKAWEVLRLDPGTGASVWLRDHADPAMAALTKHHGTFHRCSPTEHQAYNPLPADEPPPGMF